MSRYYGTEAQQRLQKKSDRMTSWIMRTPGACLTGRVLGTDDPDRLGWDVIRQHLREDGVFSFRWIDAAGLERIKDQVADLGASIHGWQGYYSNARDLRAATDTCLEQPLADGMTLEVAQAEAVSEAQAFLAERGITPLSGAVMAGENCRAGTALIRKDGGALAAAGFVGMLQNEFSPLHDCAWAGLIACDENERGKGLGRQITSELIRIALDRFGARRVMGFAAADNIASAAMLTGCGLEPTKYASYVATLSTTRFTR